MSNIVVGGIGTDVGKTVVAAILATILQGDYWKPIQCGDEQTSDTFTMQKLIGRSKHQIHPPTYSFQTPVSPHHAAHKENRKIDPDAITYPKTEQTLVIEGVGGILVPIDHNLLTIDLLNRWECKWVVVSKHYLGSINHTLLTLAELKRRSLSVVGIVFNGEPEPYSEEAILEISKLPLLGRLLPEKKIDFQTIQKYAKQWQPQVLKSLL